MDVKAIWVSIVGPVGDSTSGERAFADGSLATTRGGGNKPISPHRTSWTWFQAEFDLRRRNNFHLTAVCDGC